MYKKPSSVLFFNNYSFRPNDTFPLSFLNFLKHTPQQHVLKIKKPNLPTAYRPQPPPPPPKKKVIFFFFKKTLLLIFLVAKDVTNEIHQQDICY